METSKNNTNIVRAVAGPSLALIKYWGKKESKQVNIPATTSIGISLDTLESCVEIEEVEDSRSFFLDDKQEDFSKISPILEQLSIYAQKLPQKNMCIKAHNNFPTASGLASSASGYAALSYGLAKFFGMELENKELSALARVGSGSASRSIYAGFTIWRQGSPYAEQLVDAEHWEDFRILVCAPYTEKKSQSSRAGMIQTAKTSPYYQEWCSYNDSLQEEAVDAIFKKDIQKIGELARLSYTAMHASAIAANPPILYWRPQSIALLEIAEQLRSAGHAVWETMDAGPQVKFITLSSEIDTLQKSILERFPNIWMKVCKAGQGARIHDTI